MRIFENMRIRYELFLRQINLTRCVAVPKEAIHKVGSGNVSPLLHILGNFK